MVEIENGTVAVDKLHAAYTIADSARTVLDYFASRSNNARETKTETLLKTLAKQGTAVKRPDLIDLFRTLEDAGCGRYIAGRRGHPSRFRWNVALTSVGRVAGGGEERIAGVDAGMDVGDLPDEPMLSHDYRLRPGLTVRLALPSDLTAGEAARLAEFIRSLPFDR